MSDCFSATPNLLTPVSEAISQLLDSVNALTTAELVPLEQANQRVLATAVRSAINVPAFNNSAMDGFAICDMALETENNGRMTPANTFKVVGTALAGDVFSGKLQQGECIRIMTGAPVPSGANAVVMKENVEPLSESSSAGPAQIKLLSASRLHDNIRCAGEDIQQHQVVFEEGHQLRSVDIGVLSSLGVAQVNVIRKLKVALFSTGDELTPPGEPLQAGQIYDSNRITVKSMLQRLGAEVIDFGIIADELSLIHI